MNDGAPVHALNPRFKIKNLVNIGRGHNLGRRALPDQMAIPHGNDQIGIMATACFMSRLFSGSSSSTYFVS